MMRFEFNIGVAKVTPIFMLINIYTGGINE